MGRHETLAVVDSGLSENELIELVKKLRRPPLNEDGIDVKPDGRGKNLFEICTNRGEERYGFHLVRVVGNQVWCGGYSWLVMKALKKRRKGYRRGFVRIDPIEAFARREPFDLTGHIEDTYTSRNPLVIG